MSGAWQNCCCSIAPGGHKCVNGLAWWPGYLPFTLDDVTLNTIRFQSAAAPSDFAQPPTVVKYRTHYYRSYGVVTCTLPDSSPWRQEVEVIIEFRFDEFYGDLTYARVRDWTTTNDVGSPSNVDVNWSRSSGTLFSSSAVAAFVNPGTVVWPTDDGGGVVRIFHTAKHRMMITPFPAVSSSTAALHPNNYDIVEEDDFDPGAAGTNGHYLFDLVMDLRDGVTFVAAADTAALLAEMQTITLADQPLTMLQPNVGSLTLTRWRNPASYSEETVFAFTERAAELVSGGTSASGSNFITRVQSRHAAGIVAINQGIELPEDVIVSYGLPNGLFDGGYKLPLLTLQAGSDWWDEPQTACAVRASHSLVNLQTGLYCGNTETVIDPDTGFPVTWYYDFEAIVPNNEGNDAGAIVVGVNGLTPRVRAFGVAELQAQLDAVGEAYGAGWIGTSPFSTRPTCP